MTLKEIFNKLDLIVGTLDDAFYSLPEYNANTDSRDYIDSARNELYCLKDDVKKSEVSPLGWDVDVDEKGPFIVKN